MKKYFSLLSLVMLFMLTACNSDEPNNESTTRQVMYHRVIDTQSDVTPVHLSQSVCQFVLVDDGSKTLYAGIALMLDDSTKVEFSTRAMNLTAIPNETYTYTFSDVAATAGNHTITDIRGKVNLYGPTFISYLVDDRYRVYSTLMPYYGITSTAIVRGSDEFITDKIYYGMSIGSTVTTGNLHLYNFNESQGTTMFAQLVFRGLDLTATPTGYHLSGSDIVPVRMKDLNDQDGANAERYHASSISVDITNQGQTLSGTIVINGNDNEMEINLNGKFFDTSL